MLTIVLQCQTKLTVQQVFRRSYRPLTINFPCQWSGIIILFWHVIALNQWDGSIDQSNGRTAIRCLNKFAIQQSHSHWTQRSNGLNGPNVLIRQNSTGWVNPTGLVDLMAMGSLDHSGLIEPSEFIGAYGLNGPDWLVEPGRLIRPGPVGSLEPIGSLEVASFADVLYVWKICSIVANYDCIVLFSGPTYSSVDDDNLNQIGVGISSWIFLIETLSDKHSKLSKSGHLIFMNLRHPNWIIGCLFQTQGKIFARE